MYIIIKYVMIFETNSKLFYTCLGINYVKDSSSVISGACLAEVAQGSHLYCAAQCSKNSLCMGVVFFQSPGGVTSCCLLQCSFDTIDISGKIAYIKRS